MWLRYLLVIESMGVFLWLSEDDLKELIPTIGDRILVKELLKEVSKQGRIQDF